MAAIAMDMTGRVAATERGGIAAQPEIGLERRLLDGGPLRIAVRERRNQQERRRKREGEA